ncbi:MAG: bis-aminopropyl spermidine synthase family protein [Candidatus Pacebacteria bacterium]|nr:bis-aminopropyl spermidine synthase family protein [Candidatus Paceibacterota bacterium]MDD4201231.1 bis-aminopropyl spermidine synthase family protein [Candidatus Paceibacterota bacterium]
MRKKVIGILLKKNGIDFWELSSVIGHMVSCVRALKKMKKEGLVVFKKNKIILTEKGKKEAEKINAVKIEMPLKGKIILKENKSLLKKFKEVRKSFVGKVEYDQLQVKAESVIDKIELMDKKGDIKGKKIICIGDDDFVGIALAIKGGAEEIAVLDIDKDILNYEKEFFKKKKIKFKTILHSLTNPLPKEIKGKYDVFITEPPDTVSGNTLFFSRGVESLKEEGVGYLGISQSTLEKEKIAKIQKNILDMNMVITDVFDRFSLYDNAKDEFEWVFGLPEEISLPESSWFNSTLVRAENFKKPKPLIKGKYSKAILETKFYC